MQVDEGGQRRNGCGELLHSLVEVLTKATRHKLHREKIHIIYCTLNTLFIDDQVVNIVYFSEIENVHVGNYSNRRRYFHLLATALVAKSYPTGPAIFYKNLNIFIY